MFFFFQAEDGIRDHCVTGVQTCALPISFSINGQEGLFHCFGCQKSGDVITFVREMDHLDFVDAVERLASRAGIRSEERRVGKECGSEGWPEDESEVEQAVKKS